MGAFYRGAHVRVEGFAAPESQVIVTVAGAGREEQFNRKTRIGPAWLNAGKVRVAGAPSLFLRFTSAPMSSMGVRGFDATSLTAQMRVTPTEMTIREDYLALKRSEGVYDLEDQGVTLGSPGENGVPYKVDFRWPEKAPPARYTVHVYEVQNGKVGQETTAPLSVVRVGFPAWLAGLAEHRAPVYAVAAILFGALGGFGIDFLTAAIFRKKRVVTR
jgi:hypothetical protein